MPDPDLPKWPQLSNTGSGGILSGTATARGDIIVGSQEIHGDQVRIDHQTINNYTVLYVASARPMDLDQESGLPQKVFRSLTSQQKDLIQAGVHAGIAPPARLDAAPAAFPASSPGLDNPAAGKQVPWNSVRLDAVGPPLGINTAGNADQLADQLTKSWAEAAPQLSQIDKLLPGPLVGLEFGDQRVDVVEVLIRQGNLALWRFRRAWAGFFGEMTANDILGRLEWPWPPGDQVLVTRARTDIDVLRGVALQRMVGQLLQGRPDLVTRLAQGQWREVLQVLESGGAVDREMLQYTRVEVEAIGLPYRAEEVSSASQDAEQALGQALARQPGNAAALANLAALRAEFGLFSYIMNGTADRNYLTGAQQLYAQARASLGQPQDPAGRTELARCLLAAAMALPPNADLESVDVASTYANLQQAALSRSAQQRIRWDFVRRNLARPAFLDENGIQQAREMFAAAGNNAAATQCDAMLRNLWWWKSSRGQQMQWAQQTWPFVGFWAYQTPGPMGMLQGFIAFNAEGQFHWQEDLWNWNTWQHRSFSMGGYSINGNTINLNGYQWGPMPPQAWSAMPPVQPAPCQYQLLIQGVNPQQLWLGQNACQRV
jgi:hypothetical protein